MWYVKGRNERRVPSSKTNARSSCDIRIQTIPEASPDSSAAFSPLKTLYVLDLESVLVFPGQVHDLVIEVGLLDSFLKI